MGLALGKSSRQFSDSLRAGRGSVKKRQFVPFGLEMEMVSSLVYTLGKIDVHGS